MNAERRAKDASVFARRSALCALSLLPLLPGCGSPSAANIQLRKQNQKLQDQLARLQRQHDADTATIQSYERSWPTAPTLPQERLDKLFTTHGLAFQKMTGGDDWDPDQPGDDGLQIGIVPLDEQGEELKAAGSFKVEAFDLVEANHPLVGSWTFDTEQVRSLFYDHLTLYTYILRCPWQTKPKHGELTVRVTFRDELTGREFTSTREIKANVVNPTTQP